MYVLLSIGLIGSCWRVYGAFRTLVATKNLLKKATPTVEYALFTKAAVCISNHVNIPMAIRLFKPRIIIPSALFERNQVQLTPILLHEQAHIQRNDLWVSFFQEALAIIFWWSPIMRKINHKVHLYRELACDFRAAQTLNNNQDYAQSLLD